MTVDGLQKQIRLLNDMVEELGKDLSPKAEEMLNAVIAGENKSDMEKAIELLKELIEKLLEAERCRTRVV